MDNSELMRRVYALLEERDRKMYEKLGYYKAVTCDVCMYRDYCDIRKELLCVQDADNGRPMFCSYGKRK